MKIAQRVYSENDKERKRSEKKKHSFKEPERVFVFDTETTVNEPLKLLFGSFMVFEKEFLVNKGLIYHPKNVPKEGLRILKKYAKEHNIKLYKLDKFITKIFMKEIYDKRALCIGFNLLFDLTRLCMRAGYAQEFYKGGFSLYLSKSKNVPYIRTKSVSKTQAFIELTKQGSGERLKHKGDFLDMYSLASILASKSLSLEKACKEYKTTYKKLETEEHGVITHEYIEYNLMDTLATYDLYLKVKEQYKKYNIDLPMNKVYSAASLGKKALEQMGIQTFQELNQTFSKRMLGRIMNAYYGGRCEVQHRKKPIKVTFLDFTSMYPSVNILLGLWQFITAKKVIYKECTKEIQTLLNKITREDLRNKKLWKQLCVLVELSPDEDILPIRARFDKDSPIYNIGTCQIKYKGKLCYTLFDVIASKLFTGKTPKITKAWRFIPQGKQETLKPAIIYGESIDPRRDDPFKILVEKRQSMKRQGKDDFKQKGLKTILSSTSYGIFIEMNKQEKKDPLMVFTGEEGNEWFISQEETPYEEPGVYYNPILGVLQTAAARLLLAMAETEVQELGGYFVYCDTDGIYVSPPHAQNIIDFFEPLKPYDFKEPFLKVETEKVGKKRVPLEDVWFYGISAKRYVLYRLQGKKITILKHSLHGLGHLLSPFPDIEGWEKQIWEDILQFHYGWITKKDIIDCYGKFYALTLLTVSTKSIHKRFAKLNEAKGFQDTIKPYNFIIAGVGSIKENGQLVKQIAPYNKKDPQSVVYKKFIDYFTGRIMQGEKYWCTLAETIRNYMKHAEAKMDNGEDDGWLKRKKVTITGIDYIGKETTSIEKDQLATEHYTHYNSDKKLKELILNLTPKQAKEKYNINKVTLWKIKRRIRKGLSFKLSKKILKRLLT